jgi:hypothetical protein
MLGRVLSFTVAAFMCGQMVLIFHFVAHGDLEKPAAPIVEYKDFVTILLTCLGVMIAVATVFAAVAAVWGFDLLRRETQAHAETSAKASAEKIAHDRIEAMLPSLVERAVRFEFEMQGSQGSSGQQGLDDQADQIADEIAKDK